MLINVRPLRDRDMQFLYLGQTVSFLGSMITFVAMPWQIYKLTNSSMLVGLLATVQLFPILIFALIGGAYADKLNRRWLLIVSELAMSVGAFVLVLNAMLATPSVFLIFAMAVIMQAANGFHRPTLEALTQKMIDPKDYTAIGVLNSFRYSFGAIAGPAIGGMVIARFGVAAAYMIDVLTFAIAVVSIYLIVNIPSPEKNDSKKFGVMEGLNFARSSQVLMGTYIVDMVAMTFAFPCALFPEMGDKWGGAQAAGLLFSAMPIGSLAITILSGWTEKVKRHGQFVIYSAFLWGVAVFVMGFSHSLYFSVACLIFAGAADTVSGIFRQAIWNETIPHHMRGRLAGIEMISYMAGPLLGNTRAGWMASFAGIPMTILSGGALCSVGVLSCIKILPKFWKYESTAVPSR